MDRKKPRTWKLSTSSSKEECTCPPSRLCTCTTSIPKPPPSSQTVPGTAKPAVDTSTKPCWANQALPQEVKQEDWKNFERIQVEQSEVHPANQDFSRKNREFFQELLGPNCWPAAQQEEVFVSDEEDEVENSEFQSATGTNEDCEQVEERLCQEELDGLFSKFEDLALERTFLEQDNKQLVAEKMQREKELLEAKSCIKMLKEEMEVIVEQQLREREKMEKDSANTKACNKVLREKMESVQEQFREKDIKEKMLEQKLRQGEELQGRLGRDNENLRAEVQRLAGALESMSQQSEISIRRMVHGTRSAPGGLESLAPVWECSTCTFHNPAVNLICDMCR